MDFVFLIQTFEFYDIEEITINLLKEKANSLSDEELAINISDEDINNGNTN